MALYTVTRAFYNDEDGRPLKKARLNFYESGTYNRLDSYYDQALTKTNPNPVVSDGAGRFGNIYITEGVAYRVVLEEKVNGSFTEVWTQDDVFIETPPENLGTAANADVTTSSDDTTSGRVIRVDDFSINNANKFFAAQSRKNFIVNGAMAISEQNGFVTNATLSLGSSVFPVEHFRLLDFGSPGGVSQYTTTRTLNGSRSIQYIAVNGAVDLSGASSKGGIQHRVEAQDIFHLNSKTVTISFVANTNWSGKLPIAVLSIGANRGILHDADVVAGQNNIEWTFEFESSTVQANDNETGINIIIGWCNEGNFQGDAINNDMWVSNADLTSTESTQWVKTSGNFLEITQVQLEEGDHATPFEHLTYEEYLKNCKRYFHKFGASTQENLYSVAFGFASSATNAYFSFKLPVPMRDTPSITTNGNDFYVDATGSGYNEVVNSFTLSTNEQNQFLEVRTNSDSGLTPGEGCELYVEAFDEGEIYVDARLF